MNIIFPIVYIGNVKQKHAHTKPLHLLGTTPSRPQDVDEDTGINSLGQRPVTILTIPPFTAEVTILRTLPYSISTQQSRKSLPLDIKINAININTSTATNTNNNNKPLPPTATPPPPPPPSPHHHHPPPSAVPSTPPASTTTTISPPPLTTPAPAQPYTNANTAVTGGHRP